jgi:transposase
MESMDEKHLREKYAIENDDWERTPVSVRMIVLLLDGKIEELEGHLKDIKDLKKQLNEKVTRNSENSHSPSSSDPIGFESPRKKGVVKLKDDRNQLGTEITLIS